MYKFKPILKSMLWGGDKIIPYKGVESEMKQVGESWEISGVKDNESVIAEGADAGLTLSELIARDKEALLGKSNYERFGKEFPLLIKFIDARQDLSIQVHPNDKLAWERHQSKGKTEMWYVVDADPGSRLRSGFIPSVSGPAAIFGRSRVLAMPPHRPTRQEYTVMSGRKAMPTKTGSGM